MHHVLTKIMAVLAALATLSVATPTPAQAAVAAYFVMTDITRENFVVQLTDPAKIQHARDLISGTTTDKPHVFGRIITRPAPYNPHWSYQLNPDTVSFFDVAIEVCDATIPYVQDHLDEAGGAFLPGLVWCPWTSRLVREISAP
ncbi:calmodulin-binding protein [Nonomuraea bangladeshensis]|uniref:Calmodulin-binding protein n=1 Tax=Nonomuraea bangladeshensis TaxID=404385 RepID=A0ABV3HA06_9ACTN